MVGRRGDNRQFPDGGRAAERLKEFETQRGYGDDSSSPDPPAPDPVRRGGKRPGDAE
jgi:hypothetical protein